jgi:RNA polymerase sigma-70 factor (ECF subfamily)
LLRFEKEKERKYGVIDDEILELFSDDHVYENPEEHAMKSDVVNRLTNAINQLPPLDKELIILKYYNNMKLDDIASATSISKSTVKRHIISAQKILSELMKE